MQRLVVCRLRHGYKHLWKKKIDQVLENIADRAGLVFNMLDEVIDDFVTNFLSVRNTLNIDK